MIRLLVAFVVCTVMAACWASAPADTTTTEATTTTTATTVAPTTTTTTEEPSTTEVTEPTTTEAPVVVTTEPDEPCGRALVGIRAVGLPAGFRFYCDASRTALGSNRTHAGLTCWNCNGDGSWVAINPGTGNYEGVGAHEACHAQQFVNQGSSTEAEADACARAHGYVNPYEGSD